MVTKNTLRAELGLISFSGIGLSGLEVYIAHEKGNWGPENQGSDYREHRLLPNKDGNFAFDPAEILKDREQFKLIVPNISLSTAYDVYDKRLAEDVFVGLRLDYDKKTQTFWFLADPTDTCRIIALGYWYQNNVWMLNS